MERAEQITLKQLRALATVAEHGTITAAADTMGLTGPAVHNQLKTLEEIVETPLLFREGRQPSELTPQGRVLVDAYAEIRASLRRAQLSINALDAGQMGTVVIGCVSTAKYFAPRLVALLEKDLPAVEVVLEVGNRAETIAALSEGAFDLCIMGRPPRQPAMVADTLGDHPHVIIAAPDHPLATTQAITPETLAECRFIMRERGSGTRILATRFLNEYCEGFDPRVMEMGSNETIKQAVMSGLGIALISAHTVADELETGRLTVLDVPGLPIRRHWFLLHAPHLSATAARTRDWVLANAKRFLPSPAV